MQETITANPDILKCLNIIKERLKKNGYDRIQYLPSRRSIGKEVFVFRSFFYQKTPCLFNSTLFYTLYHFIFGKKYPELYKLYKACFMNEPIGRELLFKLFSADEVDNFIKNDIVKYNSQEYKFDFRFIPFEDLFLLGKIDIKSPEYAHLNYDSVTFIDALRKMRLNDNYKRALEIGCGAGLISIEIARVADLVDAVDINPYAKKIADINAKLNGFSNINMFISDCYDNVKQKYDLIISDPPFELMPEEDKGILHRHGGHLGMEISSRIFKGLEEHLKDGGEAIIFTNSYIRGFKIDTLRIALEEMFKNKNFKITLSKLSYQINPDYYPIYRKYNITHSIAYIIYFKKANNFHMAITPFGFFNNIREVLRLVYLYAVIFLRVRFKPDAV
ncbi:MAG: methyltransferase [Candidatus Omnitrophica bacterium]|nr:methyltransferase [Candidatus Omnitrophota bacterium]